jgi:prepilin-type N-terminal cleavage/methylation domain-containing protein
MHVKKRFRTKNAGFSPRAKRGFSLVETAIVMGIAGVVFAAIWATVSVVQQRRLVEQGATQIEMIADNMRALYTGQTGASPTPLITGSGGLVCGGVYPHDTLIGATGTDCTTWGKPASPWGGQYGVAFALDSSSHVIGFAVGFSIASPAPSMPTSSCLALVSRMAATGAPTTGGVTPTSSTGLGITSPAFPKLTLETTQEGGALTAYVATGGGGWTDVTNQTPAYITKNILGSNGCTGVAFAYSL